jgi:multisubunit Na+/H+ antiporter MnhB subunit
MGILSTTQSRWLLSVVVGVFSAVAIVSSASTLAGGGNMFSGRPGDIRGMGVMLGIAGLGIVVVWYVDSNFEQGEWGADR